MRVEASEYPLEALREMIFNALVHRDYMGAPTQLRVYDDKLMLWNAGGLPSDVNVLSLRGAHASRPRNVRLADIFFRACYIEAWGRGTVKIIDSCRRLEVDVDFEECFGGFMVGLRKPAEKLTPPVTPPVTTPVTTPVIELLAVLENEKGITALLAVLGLRDRKSLRSLYINPALEAGLIERTIPGKPRSRLQKYRLTEKGRISLGIR